MQWGGRKARRRRGWKDWQERQVVKGEEEVRVQMIEWLRGMERWEAEKIRGERLRRCGV